MAEIRVEWLSDEYECDTCGDSWASGALVYLDDKLIIELTPVAHCTGGCNYSEQDIYIAILKHLGYSYKEI